MNQQPEPVQPEQVGRPARVCRGVLFPVFVVGAALVASLLLLAFLRAPRYASPAPDLAAEARENLERRNFRPLSGKLEALLSDPTYRRVPTQSHALLGQPAPDFALPDTDGKLWTLSEQLQNRPVILVFYYGYHCDHCVSQLFGLHKDIEKFRELGASVVALSPDPPNLTRQRYHKYGAFAFPVLADSANSVAAKYGTYAPAQKQGEEGDLLHGTFVIDRRGRITWANRGDQPFVENRTLLIEVRRLLARDIPSAGGG